METPSKIQFAPLVSPRRAGYLTAKQVQPILPVPQSIETIRRWMKIGIHDKRTPNSRNKLKLRSVVSGSGWYTRAEWVAEFLTACEHNHK